MTDQELERRLRAWYRAEIGEHEDATPALRAALLEVVGSAHPRFAFGGRFWLPIAAAVSATILILTVGGSFISRPPDQPGGGPGVSPTPAASPITCRGALTTPSGSSRIPGVRVLRPGEPLQPGTIYTTPVFTPIYTIESRDCWTFATGDPDGDVYLLRGDGWRAGSLIILRPAGAWGVGQTSTFPPPADLVGWYRSRSDLVLAAPTPVVVGGFDATLLDGTVKAGAPHIGNDVVSIASEGSKALIAVATDSHFELVIVNVRGQTLLIVMQANQQTWSAVKPQLQSLLDGLTFPPTSP
jgi:hypothetical protein